MYSQNNEDYLISEYFGGRTGRLLDIGANDGVTLSNSRLLIEKGWAADLVEPSPSAFARLENIYMDGAEEIFFGDIQTYNFAIGTQTGEIEFWESDGHLGDDVALLSSGIQSHVEKWSKHVKPDGKRQSFRKISVPCYRWEDVWLSMNDYLFITIDAEGMDYEILEQIVLFETDCLCIEWANDPYQLAKISDYAESYGLTEGHRNFENVIFFR